MWAKMGYKSLVCRSAPKINPPGNGCGFFCASPRPDHPPLHGARPAVLYSGPSGRFFYAQKDAMDQEFLNWIMAGFAGLIGFLLRVVWQAVRDLQVADREICKEVDSIKVLVAGTYVTRDDMSKLSDALFHKLDKIDSKLDSKLDREAYTSCTHGR